MYYPLVSICIPTYNRPGYLELALNSALKQTYNNFEIIITDNSDNNKTSDLIKKYKNKKIRYYKNPKNIGSFKNLQTALLLTKGKYVKFLLDDDLLEKNCVEKMMGKMERYPNVGIVMAPLKIVDKNNQPIIPRFYIFKKMRYLYKYLNKNTLIDKKIVLKDFLTRIYPCCVPTGIMFRKKYIDEVGGFDKNFEYIVDVEICMRIATKYDFYYIDEFLSSWRYTSSSETMNILHKEGIKNDIYYNLANQYLKMNSVRQLFAENEFMSLKKRAYFFASKRTSLNGLAGIRSKSLAQIIETVTTINKNDPYLSNKIRLPFVLLKEIICALTT